MADVVATGIGLVTSLGATADETAAAWRAGGCALRRPVGEFDGTALAGSETAVLPAFDASARLGGRRMLKFMSHAAVLGCMAAREACSQAATRRRFEPGRVGLFCATGLAAAGVQDVAPLIEQSTDEHGRFSCRLLGERGLPATNPLLSFKILANMPPCLVSIQESIKGPNYIFTPWESQSAAALLEAWQAVAEGEVQCAVVGAADSPSNPAAFVFLRQAGLLGADEYPADGAAYVVLESAESAARSGQPVLARVDSVDLRPVSSRPCDPLGNRMGRTFAAAPMIWFALACLGCGATAAVAGSSFVCPDYAAPGSRWELRIEARGAA
ncbi:MAG TPA: beta-ketoacyl synthase N-terminal-like domain-containing protein [Planctomycetota bacterium]|nr:beta-ketoacyl synthase N-terminal-like domain-containing protein [Planctomycetota bacterium]